MAEPHIPGGAAGSLELPCGESVSIHELDMGMRDLACACGDKHAVVVDVHPVSRFVPESIVAVLQETIETEDSFPEFGMPHVMGMVMEEFPEAVVTQDVSEDGGVGYALVWVTDFDSRRLHTIVVELLVELMEHAASHGDADVATEFEDQMMDFDVEAFVDAYRDQRDFESDVDTPV